MSRDVKKPDFRTCENKDADQLRGNRKADQRLCLRYIASTIPLLPRSYILKPLVIFCGCSAPFVSDLVGNPEDRFSSERGSYELVVRKLVPFYANVKNKVADHLHFKAS